MCVYLFSSLTHSVLLLQTQTSTNDGLCLHDDTNWYNLYPNSNPKTKSSPSNFPLKLQEPTKMPSKHLFEARFTHTNIASHVHTHNVTTDQRFLFVSLQLPYFMNELKLADLDMGACLPQVLSTSKPTLDGRGTYVWEKLSLTHDLALYYEPSWLQG